MCIKKKTLKKQLQKKKKYELTMNAFAKPLSLKHP